MKLFNILAVLITHSAVFSYINYRFIKLPTTIGVMVISLLGSLGITVLGSLGFGLEKDALRLLNSIDFDETLLHGMLSFLLFAGALHIDLDRLARQKWIIGTLATVGTIGSTFIIGTLAWLVLDWLNIGLPLMHCLVFGALISPTDPIAVLGILKNAEVPESLETTICGESLFNDGIAVVVFLVLLQIATGGHDITAGTVAWLFAKEALGGMIQGNCSMNERDVLHQIQKTGIDYVTILPCDRLKRLIPLVQKEIYPVGVFIQSFPPFYPCGDRSRKCKGRQHNPGRRGHQTALYGVAINSRGVVSGAAKML